MIDKSSTTVSRTRCTPRARPSRRASSPATASRCCARRAKLKDFKAGDADEQIGVQILFRALEEPIRQIAQNAGAEGSIVVEKVRGNKNANYGYNAATDEYEDLVEPA
jgi:chaperonin GroEL (HSP60 family)